MAIIDTLSENRTQVTSFVLVFTISYILFIVIYRLFFSPMSKIPGPWMTCISTAPETKALKEQRRTQWVNSLFARYPGAVAVRTGPNSVSFNHPDAVKAIYGHGKADTDFAKSSWYDSFSTTGESLFSTRSKKRHAMKRRMVAHSFSAQSLLSFEPYVDVTIAKFMQKMDEFATTQEAFDIYFWFELFTMDLMGELALGNSFGVLEAGKPARYSALVEQSQRFSNIAGLLPFGKMSVRILSWVPVPYIQKLWAARVEYLEYARMALERRFQNDRNKVLPTGKPRQDIMQRFIEARDPETGRRMDFDELRAETSSLMVAGASTGSVTMNWMIYYLSKSPSVKSRILVSLEQMFPDNVDGSKPIPFTRLNKLSLLEHVEMECLRLHPPIGYTMPRDTPPQGAVICNVFIPGGVAVGVPAAAIGRSPSVYYDADRFDPDRWREQGADGATMKTAFLGFGYGSRQCIGRNVATQFIMKMIATLLLRYEIAMENPSLVLGTKEFTILKPDQKYRVMLTRR
ncbi:cytochrome P450 monooxygenase [Melanomma pulvis-pyrius CBS 109.77]|uniref:Cytochrome P450 monooxygenase n=1 Tax=Melanomma pulvis-pyrius CBS 109.77 TaxID=1314802 RepID=A0A6A6X210_9PLEO|nr:cytochrome P450 monooxygenase [Melanomma pulvis-pyrius CBS 109.77]